MKCSTITQSFSAAKITVFAAFIGLTVLKCCLALDEVPVQCTDCSCADPVVDCTSVCDVCQCHDDIIDCSYKKLKASFAEDPSKWPKQSISNLNLEHNLIGRIVKYPPLNVTTLNLRSNMIVRIDDRAFYNLPLLQDLDLSGNDLTEIDPEVFEGPFSSTAFEPLGITSLDLSHNELKTLDQNVFEHIASLQRLILAGNPMGDEKGKLTRNAVVAISSVPNLLILDLSDTGLTSLPPTFLRNLPTLKELVLINNAFTKLPADELAFASRLEILHFSGNPITSITTDSGFKKMPSVTQLHISHMPQLKRIEDGALKGLSGLKYLSCSNNPNLEFISGSALSSSNLIKLELHDNNLHYLPENLVKSWSKLQTVNVLGNRWSCDCDNQWFIDTLIPSLSNNDSSGILCSQPEALSGASMKKMSERKYKMRCLDYYGNHPEKDASYLVATFVLIIVALVIIAGILLWRRGRLRRGRPIDYSAIYQQHVRDEFGSEYDRH